MVEADTVVVEADTVVFEADTVGSLWLKQLWLADCIHG